VKSTSTLRPFGLALLALVLSGCVARFGVEDTLTERGLINRGNLDLGMVYLWDRAEGTTRRIGIIDPETAALRRPTPPRDISVTLTGGAEFKGGVRLSEAAETELAAEVAGRSSILSKGIFTTGFANPRKALTDAIRGAPEDWLPALDYPPAPDAPTRYVVIVSDVTRGDQLTVTVDQTAAAGTTFVSQQVRAGGAAIRFRIVDAGNLRIEGTGDSQPVLYATVLPFKVAQGANGPAFPSVTDARAMQDLAKAFASGR